MDTLDEIRDRTRGRDSDASSPATADGQDSEIGAAATELGDLFMADGPPVADVRDALDRSRVIAGLFDESPAAVKVGRFILLHPLGAGGMGEIFAAYDPELDRKVAIKLVRTGAHVSADDRLYREAQTLAQLSHPNVVQIYEVGRSQGQVFLAMEFVRGCTLGDWLERDDGHDWRDILDVMVAAGRGVAAAHDAGLMHRDFKPANVLVGDDGQVRVIDFGLARSDALGASQADEPERVSVDESAENVVIGARAATSLTVTGAILGTPAYMSPEQMTAGETDRRSDQWSFCVTLYEALYGRRPFAADSVPELERAITSDARPELPRGSAVPTRVGNIVLRGLAVKPDDRYPDMRELLDALDHAATQRRRRVVRAGLGLAAALALGVALASLIMPASAPSADPCATAGDDIAAVWNPELRSSIRAAFSASGVPFADDSFATVAARVDRYASQWSDERAAACRATHVQRVQTIELLELRALCLDRRMVRLRGLVTAWQNADAILVENAVQAASELPDVASCADAELLRLGMRPPEEPEIARQVDAIRAHLARGHALRYTGDYDGGIAIADAQAVASERLAYPPIRAEALYLAGRLRILRNRDDDAARGRQHLLDAVGLAETSRHDQLAARIWNTLTGLQASDHPDLPQRRQFSLRAVAAVGRIGNRGPEYVQVVHDQGLLRYLDKRHDEALSRFDRALALAARDEDSALAAAILHHERANALVALGRADEARQAYELAASGLGDLLGHRHPNVARLDYDIGLFLTEMGEFEAALERLGDGPETWAALQGDDGVSVGRAHLALADLTQQMGLLDDAEQHAQRAHAVYEQHYRDSNKARLIQPTLIFAIIEYRKRKFERSLALWQQAIALYRDTLPADASPDDLNLALFRNNMGETLVGLGRYQEALAIFADTERVFRRAGTDHPMLLALPDKGRGVALLGHGKAARAVAPLDRALRLFRDFPGYPLERADTAWALARAVRASGGDESRIRALVEEARALYGDHGPAGARVIREIADWLAQ